MGWIQNTLISSADALTSLLLNSGSLSSISTTSFKYRPYSRLSNYNNKMNFNRVKARKWFLRTTSSESWLSFEAARGLSLLTFSTTGGAIIVKIRAKKQTRPIFSSIINLKYLQVRSAYEMFIWIIWKLRKSQSSIYNLSY